MATNKEHDNYVVIFGRKFYVQTHDLSKEKPLSGLFEPGSLVTYSDRKGFGVGMVLYVYRIGLTDRAWTMWQNRAHDLDRQGDPADVLVPYEGSVTVDDVIMRRRRPW